MASPQFWLVIFRFSSSVCWLSLIPRTLPTW